MSSMKGLRLSSGVMRSLSGFLKHLDKKVFVQSYANVKRNITQRRVEKKKMHQTNVNSAEGQKDR